MTKRRGVRYRSRVVDADAAALRRLVASPGVFRREERAVALELLEARLTHGSRSGYSFFFAERGAELLGYAAWGRTPLTQRTFDLYWIVVAPAAQGQGLGRALLELVEGAVAAGGGGRLYIETSSRKAYARSRRFYREAGYRRVAELRDFYAPRDHKVMFCKVIPARRRGRAALASATGGALPEP
jgi:ribosomal protein S18 acetylase RimI-like enzyme